MSVHRRDSFKLTKEMFMKHIPILNQIGISDFVNPLDIYLALEEYFKNQIEANERRDPIGTTDNDKVAMHGFDDKSFRKEKSKK